MNRITLFEDSEHYKATREGDVISIMQETNATKNA